ncbi:unnamed protein product, partial [Mesorhabditis belari]|uniref:Uncharacterized protein n=1 Tax=Mesorhabditis belari TaxID=2138241 RepID=A0AAF3F856_9BILA
MVDDEQTESSSTHGNEIADGEENQSMDFSVPEASTPESLAEEVAVLTKKCNFLSHQLNMIMSTMKVPPCLCASCEEQFKEQRAEENKTIKKMISQQQQHFKGPATPLRTPLMPFGFHLPTPAAPSHHQTPSTPKTPNIDDPTATLTENEAQFIQQLMATENAHIGGQAGRRSKYCNPEEKKAVAEYAQVHGAAAAARRFGIPAPVASYYHRKASQKAHQSQQQVMLAAAAAAGVSPSLFLGAGPPVLTPSTPNEETTPQNTPSNTQPSTPQPNQCEMAFKMNAMPGFQQPPPTSSGMFVRGRGRGRPKLIGDELDMHLVEYMVKLKKTDPSQHLTASKALDIARDYIVAKQPGLLEEHGGQVKLKITWAMKLVQRVAEREREIEMGLPPGTLQNLGRLVQQMPNGAINPMDLMSAQSMLAGGLMGQNGQNAVTPADFEALFQAFAQSAQQQAGEESTCMPEIIKGQEIDIAALLGLCGEKEEKDGSHEDGDDDDDGEPKEEESAPSISPQSADDQSINSTPNSHANFIFAS